MELYLSSLPTSIPSSICAWNLERRLALHVSWLKYPIENSSSHALESDLELCTSSNGVVSLRSSRPWTWFSIVAACRTAKYQNYRPNFFYLMNACAISIKLRHVRSANSFKDWHPAGAEIVLETFDNIHQREFPPINFLSKSEWNRWGRHPAYVLNISKAEVIDVDDSNDVP